MASRHPRWILLALVSLALSFGTVSAQQADLGRMGREFERIAEKLAPSVVDVLVQELVLEESDGPTAALESKRLFRCSGVISSRSGEIITLLKDGLPEAEAGGDVVIQVTLHDGTAYAATLTAHDPATGVALLKMADAPKRLQPVVATNRVKKGSLAVAVGSSLGMGQSFKFGMVSSVNRRVRSDEFSFPRAIQTDIAAEPGLVGGMLANTHGELVGLLAFSYSPSQGARPRDSKGAHVNESTVQSPVRGALMAIPSDLLLRICSELRKDGRVQRGALLVSFKFRTHMELKTLKIQIAQPGAQVQWVGEGGAADKAGLERHDIVTQVDGRRLKSERDLSWFSELVEYGKIGSEHTVHIYRCREGFRGYRMLTIKIEPRPERMPHLRASD